jgi:hypothetical protein
MDEEGVGCPDRAIKLYCSELTLSRNMYPEVGYSGASLNHRLAPRDAFGSSDWKAIRLKLPWRQGAIL